MDTNFDEIVHFRNKEVVVYPDQATKPEHGEGLNRLAIISLERIWPLNSDRQLIKVRTAVSINILHLLYWYCYCQFIFR